MNPNKFVYSSLQTEQFMYFKYSIFVLMALLTSIVDASQRDDALANISVYAALLDGQATYTYTVNNTGKHAITGFSVGFDHYTGSSELSGALPVEISSPASWESRIIFLEESDRYEVRWETSNIYARLNPDMVMSGFKVVLSSPNTEYLSAHWTAILSGAPTFVSSKLSVSDIPPIENSDITPPVIAIEFVPNILWPPNNKLVSVSAMVAVTDNVDNSPVVKLVSITCNDECDLSNDISDASFGESDFDFKVRATRQGRDKLGRVYTVTYSALDRAGNYSERSADIIVPHDKR
jgi:hypothetical protein